MARRLPANQFSPLLEELLGGMGAEATRALVAWRGGVRLYVPSRLPLGHELVLRLGEPAARFLVQRYAGSLLMIPRAAHQLRAQRDAAIRAAYAGGSGESCSALALRYGLHLRQVWRIVNAADVAVPQMTLFNP